MIYMKHPVLGNAHFDDAEQADREADGWVSWPRAKQQKEGVSPPEFVAADTLIEPHVKRKYTRRATL